MKKEFCTCTVGYAPHSQVDYIDYCAVHGAAAELLEICEEIASDPRCDLIDSERRIRLYAAIQKANGGEL